MQAIGKTVPLHRLTFPLEGLLPSILKIIALYITL